MSTGYEEQEIRSIVVEWLGGMYSNRYAGNPDYLNENDVQRLVTALFERAWIKLK